MNMDMALPTISVCICTSGRPAELRRCLDSIAAGTRLPDEVLVSDDSCGSTASAVRQVCDHYPFVQYLEGPRRGLCANRNAVVRPTSGDYVSLLDDDAVVGPDFIRKASERASSLDGRTILTGDVLERGTVLTPPRNPTFLGHFGRKPSGTIQTIHLNCNLFPREALERVRFDEDITYGYEDMDLCAALLAYGYRIEYVPTLRNSHLPPGRSDGSDGNRRRQAERARLYTSLKRYSLWQRRPWATLCFLGVAPFHLVASGVRRRGLSGLAESVADAVWAVSRFLQTSWGPRPHRGGYAKGPGPDAAS